MSDDKVYLTYILESINNINEVAGSTRDEFEADKHDVAAALYYLHTLAEATQRLSEPLKLAHPEIDWVAIAGFRNRLVHGYLNINRNTIWNVIVHNLPPLKKVVEDMLSGMS
ncbi:MAG: HepT-like ribonuclease domain-containing protein [Chloroflexota bacterium]|nr:HepT-like ribonuclease domain-containing protein [Chloroflexota bacterium]